MISKAEYAKIKNVLESQGTLKRIKFRQKDAKKMPFSLSITPEGIAYIHLGKRGRLVGEGTYKKFYEAVRIEGGSATKFGEARVKKTSEIKATLTENELAKKFTSPHNIPSSETVVQYKGKQKTKKARLMQPLLPQDGKKFIAANPTLSKSLQFLEDTARGLKVLHDQGYMHRDLKPANILIDDTGAAKLADLGYAVPEAAINTFEGTSKYLPLDMLPSGTEFLPEKQTRATDMYALGVMIDEILGRITADIAKGIKNAPDDLMDILNQRDDIPDKTKNALLDLEKLGSRLRNFSRPKRRPTVDQALTVISSARREEKVDWKSL